jgi:hypothetical protein
MHFFLFDFALAFIALLGYRAVGALLHDRAAAVSPGGGPLPRPAFVPHGVGGSMACCPERAAHRLINFW